MCTIVHELWTIIGSSTKNILILRKPYFVVPSNSKIRTNNENIYIEYHICASHDYKARPPDQKRFCSPRLKTKVHWVLDQQNP